MSTALNAAGLIVLAFLCGSIPFGLVVSRLFFGVDIRAQGSGNIGAANALRTLGKGAAAGVLLLDVLKGALPTAIASGYGGAALPWLAPAAGAAAVLGHVYSPWLHGRGGKGVATHLGVLVALAWPAALAFAASWIAAVRLTKYSSVGSLSGTVAAALVLCWIAGPFAGLYGLLAVLLIGYTHRENIARLRAGTENPLR